MQCVGAHGIVKGLLDFAKTSLTPELPVNHSRVLPDTGVQTPFCRRPPRAAAVPSVPGSLRTLRPRLEQKAGADDAGPPGKEVVRLSPG